MRPSSQPGTEDFLWMTMYGTISIRLEKWSSISRSRHITPFWFQNQTSASILKSCLPLKVWISTTRIGVRTNQTMPSLLLPPSKYKKSKEFSWESQQNRKSGKHLYLSVRLLQNSMYLSQVTSIKVHIRLNFQFRYFLGSTSLQSFTNGFYPTTGNILSS